MKRNNRETLQRAVCIIEGASYGAKSHVQDALATAIEMLDAVLDDETAEAENSYAESERGGVIAKGYTLPVF